MSRLLKLDRMEIIGFKSFYGRTLFEFPEGITAVVGPNGCGKSNIGDAISWVLGEQRASSLRSDRMEDVIFNGSEAKRPLGMAEVSLHFKSLETVDRGHNGHGGDGAVAHALAGGEIALPIAEVLEVAADEPAPVGSEPGEAEERPRPRFLLEEIPEEVVVTRRLYRSGESEYALNGQRCRLKDIQELLARTQIGTRLYTTIEQGKIDQILTSKPKDRRAIIEEAAGILGYKAKRRQAELKLEAAQANLLRLSDITGEVEKQIGALKRQAAKARRYRRLQETLRARRASIAHRKVLACDEEHRRALEGSDALRVSEAAAAAGLARADADVEALRLRLEEGEEASRRRREAIHALDMEIDRLKVRLRAGEEQARDLTGRIGEAGGEIESLLGRVAEQEARCASLEAEIAEVVLRAGEAEAELRRVEEERRDRARAIEERETSLATARADLMAHLDLLSGTTQARATLEEQVRSGPARRDGRGRRSVIGSPPASARRRSACWGSSAARRKCGGGRRRSRRGSPPCARWSASTPAIPGAWPRSWTARRASRPPAWSERGSRCRGASSGPRRRPSRGSWRGSWSRAPPRRRAASIICGAPLRGASRSCRPEGRAPRPGRAAGRPWRASGPPRTRRARRFRGRSGAGEAWSGSWAIASALPGPAGSRTAPPWTPSWHAPFWSTTSLRRSS